MNWEAYIRQLVTEQNEFSNLHMSFDGEKAAISPIVRASVLMLDKMLENGSKYNIFVFPEKEQTVFLVAIMKLLHNINSGRVRHSYDPSNFTPGMKLRFGKAICEFVSFFDDKGVPKIRLKFAPDRKRDGPTYITSPVEIVPVLQHTTTTKQLSKSQVFYDERKTWRESHSDASKPDILVELDAHKSHMESSVFFMSTVSGVREQFSATTIQGRKITDLLLVSQANYKGELQSLSTKKISGTPAFILAPDLYAIRSAIDEGAAAQSLILDISDTNRIMNQLDALDDLIDLQMPILCATDTANSFELQELTKRGFKVWRWDATNITEDLYDADGPVLNKRVRSCANQRIEYIPASGSEIKEVLTAISIHRRESEEQSAGFLKLFGKLTGLAFDVLHQIVPFRPTEIDIAKATLDECSELLSNEKNYIPEKMYDDMNHVIENLRVIYQPSFHLNKIEKLESWIRSLRQKKVCLIVANGINKKKVLEYWQGICLRSGRNNEITVFYPDEYLNQPFSRYNLTIISGWLRSNVMRRILHGYKTDEYAIVLYGYEQRWQKSLTNRWKRDTQQSNNADITREYLSCRKEVLNIPEPTTIPVEDINQTDELTDIEKTIQENRIRQYTGTGSSGVRVETVQAYPVSFVGNYLAFYRTTHKLLSATKIILEGADKIHTVFPREIVEGDFIVIRESNKDIITEMADRELVRLGKGGLRELATKWRDVLQLELIFSDVDELYSRMQGAGCTVAEGTFRNWLEDEDMISPQSKDDLRRIALVCDSPMLSEMVDDVFNAATEVKAAHTHAGVALSRLLKERIAQELQEYGEIDAFNIWAPIDMDVEGIGKVRVLKVIDIEPALMIDSSNTNRLLNE